MPLATLATPQTKRQLTDLIARIVLDAPGGTYDVNWGQTSVTVETKTGGVVLRAVCPRAGKWVVQASENISTQYKLPLWRDTY